MRSGSNAGSGSAGGTSASLIERVRQRDADAWQRLVDLYGPLVYGHCRAASLGPEDAADVVQEVFSAVARAINEFRLEGGTFRGWLVTIARNKIRDHYRGLKASDQGAGGTAAQQWLAEIPDGGSLDSSEGLPPTEVSGLFHRGLEMVRAEFEDRTWHAFWRVAVEGHSTADVAADLGITPNAVRQSKSRVLRRLRQELGDLA